MRERRYRDGFVVAVIDSTWSEGTVHELQPSGVGLGLVDVRQERTERPKLQLRALAILPRRHEP
ncbi:hypothetical protein EXIGUO8A_700002 [Exiguobacterium sp. 8A]|nr:hypothetical protein EXIGUO8A_700002 [Exiguobacterium sp. 8A]